MRFPAAFLDEIRERIKPSEVIGRVVTLRGGARGEFTALCPFHQEKSPSFTVSDQKGFYHCFGCGAHGDVIHFTMEKQGLSFTETVEKLALEAGLELPKVTEEAKEVMEKHARIQQIMELACIWFEEQLKRYPNPQRYIEARKLKDTIVRQFRLGFAPDERQGLLQHLSTKAVSQQEMLEAGLIIQNERESYDRFRNRLMFPIQNARGQVVAFGGRILGEGQPKYLNSPETILFHKSQMLYAWHFARERAYLKDAIVAVEGYMDAIALHQAGILNAVAPLGTAMSESHLELLWKAAKEPVICLDGDAAGVRAMARVAALALPLLKPGFSLKFAFLPKGMDPDDVINHLGAADLRKMLIAAKPLSQAVWDMVWEKHIPQTPEQRASFEADLMAQAKAIQDPTVQQNYRNFFKERLYEWKGAQFKKGAKRNMTPSVLKYTPDIAPRERWEQLLTEIIYHHPALLQEAHIESEFSHLESTPLEPIRQAMLELYHQGITGEEWKSQLEKILEVPHIQKLKVSNSCSAKHGEEVARAEWEYAFASLTLLMTEREVQDVAHDFEREVSESQLEKLNALQKQMELLKQAVALKRDLLEVCLEAVSESASTLM